jgi:branched-chain amino acid transport system permease protein
MRRRIPWGAILFLVAFIVPFLGSPLYTHLATDAAIWALFAISLNLLVGYTGLVSFGHAAYFGIGAYTCGLLMKNLGVPFPLAFLAAGATAAFFAAVYGYFCVKLTRVYFAMLTLAFAWISWAVCFRWNEVTGGDQGLFGVPLPNLEWMQAVPLIGGRPSSDYFHFLAVVLVAVGIWTARRIVESPFGLILTTIRDNPERAESIGIDVRRYQHVVFIVAGALAGFAGALFGIFNRGVYPDFMHWTKGAEVLIMTLLGGMGTFYGPAVGTFLILWLNQEITAITEYWSLVLGIILGGLILALPAGVLGSLVDIGHHLRRRRAGLIAAVRPDAENPSVAGAVASAASERRTVSEEPVR